MNMTFYQPTDDEIKAQISGIDEIDILGYGGYKVVYRVKIGGNYEALKLIFIPNPSSTGVAPEEKQEVINRTKREIQTLDKCSSKEIVKLGSVSPHDISIQGNIYIAYSEEYLNGENLRLIIERGEKPSESEIRTLMVSTLQAIRELWSFGIIHRDIKPENIILSTDPGRGFVLLDLGLAFSLSDTPLTHNTLAIPGTLRYLAPEMLIAGFRASLDFRSDIYSMAVTIYEYASSMHPLAKSKDDLIKTLSRIAKESPVPLKKYRSDIDEPLAKIIDQMMKKIPALRPSNINRLLSQLEGK